VEVLKYQPTGKYVVKEGLQRRECWGDDIAAVVRCITSKSVGESCICTTSLSKPLEIKNILLALPTLPKGAGLL
jgi:hypothetical protein